MNISNLNSGKNTVLSLKPSKTIRLLLMVFLMLTFSFANAATRTSTATGGSWTTGTTWIGGTAPNAGDDVIIATTGANTVSLGGNVSITNVTVNAGATLNIANRTLTASGFFTNNGTVTVSTGRITTTAGDFSNSGTLTYSGTGRLYLGGDYTNTGTITLFSALVYFTGGADQSIQGFTTTGTVRSDKTGGTAIFTGNVNGGGLTLAGNGTINLGTGLTHTFNGTWTRTNGTLNCGSSLLRIGASISGTGGAFVAGTGTVEYYLDGNQTAAVLTYNNLILSGTSGTRVKTFATTPTVNGKLTISGTATITVSTGAVTYGPNASLQYDTTNVRTVSSEEWVTPFMASGGVVINGTNNITLNVIKVFELSSPLTITSTGKLLTNDLGLTFGGDFINDGGTFFAGNSPIIIANTMTNQSIAGFTTTGLVTMTKTAGTATLTGNVNGGGLTINGTGGTLNLGSGLTHTFTGAIALTNGTLNGGSSILNANSTSTAWSGTGTNFVAGTGTVNFGGVNQTLSTVSTFNNLTFSNSGTKTLSSLPIVNRILSMEGTAIVSAAPTYGAAATLQYNRTVDQNTGMEWIPTFAATGGVSIINTGVITVDANKTFNATVPLNIATGATLSNGGFLISGGSTLAIANSGTLLVSGTSLFPVFTTTSLDANSTVNYTGTAQTVAIKNYGNLLLSGSGNKTFAGSTVIAGDFQISGTTLAILPDGSTSSSDSLTLGGVLQTALGSWGGTGSSATNPDGTWFGTSTTGLLNVTSSCLPGTWLGITNTDWNTPSNWCGGSIPTAISDVTIGFTSNQPVIGASGGLCRNIIITNGATLTISGSNSLAIRGNWTNNGTFNSNASTVVLNGTVAQTIGGSSTTTFNNLTNSNITAIITATVGITIKNNLNIANAASVLNLGSFTLTDGGTFSNSGTGHVQTSNTSSNPIPTGKSWSSVITYSNATGGQTIVAGTYNGSPALELDNSSGTQTAGGPITTNGQLNINNGGSPFFDMNGYNLTTSALNIMAPNAVLDMRTGTLTCVSVLSMDGKVRFSGAANARPFSSGTVEYYGTSQTVTSGNYFNLLFTGTTGVYTMASDIDVAHTLNVTGGALTLLDGFKLSVGDVVTVVNPASLTIENNAGLLQTTYTGANVGNVIVKRNTSPVLEFDATYWSSPTTGTQTLFDFSPLTDWNRFNTYNSVNDAWIAEDAPTTVFEKGKGYSIRCPNTTSSTIPTMLSHQFVGVPNNGTINVPVTTPPSDVGISLIGNPYPSAINADDFILENLHDPVLNPANTLQGTLYFWTHNNRLIGNDFNGDDYYYYNLSGGAGSYGSTGTGNNTLPTGYIASGQGFFVENTIAGNVKFNNTMREQNNNSNFYRTKNVKKTAELERHRIWLNITDSTQKKGTQMMVGYIENATDNYDPGYDAFVFDDTVPFLLYSLIGTDKMAIQGRELPFSSSDLIPLGYSINVADNATISMPQFDGLFIEDQAIYLEDKLLNVVHDIKTEPYTFASAAGTFNDRFVLRFTDGTLGTKNFDTQTNKVLVSSKNKQIKINAFSETIDKIAIYDLSGRQVYQKDKINTNEFLIVNLPSSHQALVVKTTLQNGATITNKTMY